MSKFLNLWEMDYSRMPADPKERMAMQKKQLEAVIKMLNEGEIIDWGIFPGGGSGFGISEGTEADALRRAMQFIPYAKFQTFPVLSASEVVEVMKSLQA